MKSYLTLGVAAAMLLSCTQKNSDKLQAEKDAILADLSNISAQKPSKALEGTEALFPDNVYQTFENPPERTAENGLLNTELNIAYSDQLIWNALERRNLLVTLRNYEGSLVPPTLRLKQGDLLRVKMNNQLPLLTPVTDCDPYGHAHFSGADTCNQKNPLAFNTTNLHTHGLHVSPSDSSDNVLVHLMPGCDFQNHIQLPGDHPQGTFWYHAHVHGSTAVQVSSGMGGAIIVEGGMDTLPAIKDAAEKIFVLQQIPYTLDTLTGKYGVENFEASFGPGTWEDGVKKYGWRTTINGQTYPIIYMKSGEVQRWRFIHAGVRETINLQLDDHKLYEIAMDGISLGRMDAQDTVELQPGYRSDILVKAKKVNLVETHFLIDREAPQDKSLLQEYESPKVLAVVIILPEVNDMALPTNAELAQYAPFKSIGDDELEPPQQLVWFNIDVNRNPICFTVNDRPFSMDNPPRKLRLNSANEWKLTSNFVNHPFHIHINSFEIFKVKNADGSVSVFDPPIWKDTYLIREHDTVFVRSRYEDYTGEFVLHCHILDHEDQGMMELVEIVDDPLTLAEAMSLTVAQCKTNVN